MKKYKTHLGHLGMIFTKGKKVLTMHNKQDDKSLNT